MVNQGGSLFFLLETSETLPLSTSSLSSIHPPPPLSLALPSHQGLPTTPGWYLGLLPLHLAQDWSAQSISPLEYQHSFPPFSHHLFLAFHTGKRHLYFVFFPDCEEIILRVSSLLEMRIKARRVSVMGLMPLAPPCPNSSEGTESKSARKGRLGNLGVGGRLPDPCMLGFAFPKSNLMCRYLLSPTAETCSRDIRRLNTQPWP